MGRDHSTYIITGVGHFGFFFEGVGRDHSTHIITGISHVKFVWGVGRDHSTCITVGSAKRNGCFRRPFQAKRCNNIEFGERGHASSFAMSVTGGLFFLEPGMSPFVRWIQPRKLWKKILRLRNNKGTQENTKHKSNPQVCEVRLNRMLNPSSGKVLKRPPQSYGRGAPLQHVALSNGPVRPLVFAQ